jgi:hypothetical protein
LYDVQSLILNLQKKDAAPWRSASARMTHVTHLQYYTTDPTPEEPAYVSYVGLDHAGAFQPEHMV